MFVDRERERASERARERERERKTRACVLKTRNAARSPGERGPRTPRGAARRLRRRPLRADWRNRRGRGRPSRRPSPGSDLQRVLKKARSDRVFFFSQREKNGACVACVSRGALGLRAELVFVDEPPDDGGVVLCVLRQSHEQVDRAGSPAHCVAPERRERLQLERVIFSNAPRRRVGATQERERRDHQKKKRFLSRLVSSRLERERNDS